MAFWVCGYFVADDCSGIAAEDHVGKSFHCFYHFHFYVAILNGHSEIVPLLASLYSVHFARHPRVNLVLHGEVFWRTHSDGLHNPPRTELSELRKIS